MRHVDGQFEIVTPRVNVPGTVCDNAQSLKGLNTESLLIPEGVRTQTVPVLGRRREVVVEFQIEYCRMWNLRLRDVN